MNKRELYYQRLISCGLGVIFLQIRKMNDVKINFCYSILVYKIHVIIKLWHIVQILNTEH